MNYWPVFEDKEETQVLKVSHMSFHSEKGPKVC
jgi:hypothetical protein